MSWSWVGSNGLSQTRYGMSFLQRIQSINQSLNQSINQSMNRLEHFIWHSSKIELFENAATLELGTVEPCDTDTYGPKKTGRNNRVAVLKGFFKYENDWLSFCSSQNKVAVITRWSCLFILYLVYWNFATNYIYYFQVINVILWRMSQFFSFHFRCLWAVEDTTLGGWCCYRFVGLYSFHQCTVSIMYLNYNRGQYM